jgi:hypothetical protein
LRAVERQHLKRGVVWVGGRRACVRACAVDTEISQEIDP